ncbi:ABC transporter permease [Fulvivirgaceae bacterium BMA10]|uniref:ABC transporter permease n=1 Tax=Splendidivirga corallicola TaxID=3051826 RepID=A0ABT8KVC3_9BACT|nr:ABC transporter permease [Fulvivirgaceae bacterium BMA10]
MFENHIKIAFRNLSKSKVYSFINIFGLALGMAACLLIIQYVNFELSFDGFHAKNPNIYRIRFDRIYPEKHDKSAGATAFVGPALKDEFPEVVAYSKIWGTRHISNVMSYGTKSFNEQDLYYADSAFLNIFSYELIQGDPVTALAEPYSIVLTERTAKKYFGEEDPLGKELVYSGSWGKANYLVTGVAKDMPENTHLKFETLISFKTLVQHTEGSAHDSYGWNAFQTYILLRPGTNYLEVEEKLPSFVNKHYENLQQNNIKAKLYLQPIQDIHLHSNLRFEPGINGNAQTVYFLLIIAIFILVIAWVNYINLSTARAIDRSKEVAVRKVSGAKRIQLIKQFLFEAMMINTISLVIALTMLQLSWPFFKDLIGKDIGIALWSNISLQMNLLIVFLIGSILSGLYPAFVLSSFDPIRMLKQRGSKVGNVFDLRKILVVFQFVISIILIAGTLTVFQQLSFMRNQELGMSIEETVVVKGAGYDATYQVKLDNFRNRILGYANVYGMTNSTSIPGGEITWVNNSVRWDQNPETDLNSIPFIGVNEDFVSTFQMKLIFGRDFSREQDDGKQRVILTKTASELLGFQKPSQAVNEKIVDGNVTYDVIGVIENFHQKSLNEHFQPIIFRYVPIANSFYSIKVNPENIKASITAIENAYKEIFPENPFEFFFLDEYYGQQYSADQRFGQVFSTFSILAILIAGMGLFGLSSFIIAKRTKEIGIRKILGASVTHVFVMLSSGFLRLSFIAACIALPLAYIGLRKWLDQYPFKIELGWNLMVIPALMVIAITLMTITYQTIKAAIANPVDALRYE